MTDSESGGVLVFLEQSGGVIEKVSLEVLGKGREIADRLGVSLTGLLLGHSLAEAAKDCSKRGADLILLGDSSLLAEYTTEAYLKVMAPLVSARQPEIILIGATHNGTALAASLAIRMKAGLIAHVVDLDIEESTGSLLGSVPGFGGSIVAVCKCKKKPQVATVRPGVFKPAEIRNAQSGAVVPVTVDLAPEDVKCQVVEKHVEESVEIGRAAKVVVAGLGCIGNLQPPKELAEVIDGTLAVSRPVADKGLAAKELVVGSSGSGLNAKLAVVVGVSGAAHFTSGIRGVETVVAINTDPQAQIFQHADYCVVADAGKVIPKLVAELGGSPGGGQQT